MSEKGIIDLSLENLGYTKEIIESELQEIDRQFRRMIAVREMLCALLDNFKNVEEAKE